MKTKFEVEVCVDSIESAIVAENAGANRIELCSSLAEGGLTPSFALIALSKKILKIPIMVMIRPRAGDFYYSELEFEVMKKDILCCKELNVDGVVFGMLTPQGKVDKERTTELVTLANPMKVCFHRAIDMTNNYFEAFEDIIECGCTRVLTSGKENKAILGLDNIAKIQLDSKGRIEVMAGSGVSADNAKEIYSKTKINHFHLSAKTIKESKMEYRNKGVSMSDDDFNKEYDIPFTDSKKIEAIIEVLDKLS